MKNLKTYLFVLLLSAYAFAAFGQSRVNSVIHTPNPAYNGGNVTAMLNVNIWNSCDYFNTAYVYPNGATITVYLDFNILSGFCLPYVSQSDINVGLGNLSTGTYTVNFYDWDSGAFERSYTFTVYGNSSTNSCSNPAFMSCGNTYFGNNGNGNNNYTTYYQGSTAHTGLTGREMVYQFTLTATSNITLNLTNLSADCDIFLAPSCSPNTIIALSENSNASSEIISYNNLAAGTYYVFVDGWNGAVSNYYLALNCSVSGCGTPALSQLSAYNITQATATISCTMTGVISYQFRAKSTNSPTWTTFNSSSSNALSLSNLVACTSYDFQCRVYCNNGWSAWSSTKSFSTLCVQNCTAPSLNQIYVSSLGQTSVQLNCAVSGVYYYDWSYRPCGNGPWTNLPYTSTNYTFLSGLSPNTCYEFAVTVYCYNNTWSDWSLGSTFTTLGYGVTNDEPCGATTLYVGSSCNPTAASNIGATTTYNPAPPTQCNTTNMRDVWFRFTMPSSGIVTFRTFAGSMTDGVIAAYSGTSCVNLSYFGCVDDNSGNLMPYGNITANPGSTIYLRMWGYNGSVGTFSICLQTVAALIDPNGEDVLSTLVFNADTVAERAEVELFTQEATAAPNSTLKLYPVPALDHITLEIELAMDATINIQVFDLTGKVVREVAQVPATVGIHTHILEIADLPQGSYVTKVQAGDQLLTGRFMKVGN